MIEICKNPYFERGQGDEYEGNNFETNDYPYLVYERPHSMYMKHTAGLPFETFVNNEDAGYGEKYREPF